MLRRLHARLCHAFLVFSASLSERKRSWYGTFAWTICRSIGLCLTVDLSDGPLEYVFYIFCEVKTLRRVYMS